MGSAFNDTAISMGRFSAIPGSAFGASGCIRFGYAGVSLDDIERLAEAIKRGRGPGNCFGD